jgi:hypothetical protein
MATTDNESGPARFTIERVADDLVKVVVTRNGERYEWLLRVAPDVKIRGEDEPTPVPSRRVAGA